MKTKIEIKDHKTHETLFQIEYEKEVIDSRFYFPDGLTNKCRFKRIQSFGDINDVSLQEDKAVTKEENLRKCFDENLVEPFLGKDYYNLAMDVYECDKRTTEDLKKKFEYMIKENKNLIKIVKISLIINLITILSLIFILFS